MIISPRVIIEKNILESSDGGLLSENQIQSNGIDVKIKEAYELSGHLVYEELPIIKKGSFEKIRIFPDEKNFFNFNPDIPYSIECYERVKIPKNMAAMVYGRSTFNRRGVFIRSSFYDSGFCNTIGFTLYPWIQCSIKKGSRIAQIVFFEADSGDNLYNGQYQGL